MLYRTHRVLPFAPSTPFALNLRLVLHSFSEVSQAFLPDLICKKPQSTLNPISYF